MNKRISIYFLLLFTLTFISRSATIEITNPSFESDLSVGWTGRGGTTGGRIYNSQGYSVASDGIHVLYLNAGALYQDVVENIEPGTTYTLTVDVGGRVNNPAGWVIRLIKVAPDLTEAVVSYYNGYDYDPDPAPVNRTVQTAWTSPMDVSSGNTLRVELAMNYQLQPLFDNVRLDEAVNGLLGYWKFDSLSGTTATDEVKGNDGVIVGGTALWQRLGQQGNSILFAGDGAHIEVPNESDFDIATNNITVMCWVNIDEFTVADQVIISKGSTGFGLQRNASTNGIAFRLGSSLVVNSTSDIDDGKWHHIAGVYDGSVMTLYIDSVESNSVSGSISIPNNNDPVWISGCSDQYGKEFNGIIDNVKIYDIAMGASDIKTLFVSQGGKDCADDISADVNDDCQVNVEDITAVSQDWMKSTEAELLGSLAKIAKDWHAEIIAEVDQSYCGWGVAIGDADNDGANEILTTGSPDSRLELYEKVSGNWQWRTLISDLAHRSPARSMGLTVKIDDINSDGINEIILGTGQETLEPAYFYLLQTDGTVITKNISTRSFQTNSAWTHNFGIYDIDGDGIKEVISSYCGTGEITRFDFNIGLTTVTPRHIYQNDGSGEDTFIVDVDNDGQVELLTADSYRVDLAKVRILEFDPYGEVGDIDTSTNPGRVVIDGYDNIKCFHCAMEVGDVDNDGDNELVVVWKHKETEQYGTIRVYDISPSSSTPTVLYTFMYQDPLLDEAFNERMTIIADVDNDGDNEMIVTTRGDYLSKEKMGHIFMFEVLPDGSVDKTLLVDFNYGKGDSLWPAVGDADNDGLNEIIIATGVGNRGLPGTSHLILLEKK